MESFDDKKRRFIKFLEVSEYIEEAAKLLEKYKTTREIPDEEFKVRDLDGLRLKLFCIEMEERKKRAH